MELDTNVYFFYILFFKLGVRATPRGRGPFEYDTDDAHVRQKPHTGNDEIDPL